MAKNNNQINVLIADSQCLTRLGMRIILSKMKGFKIVSEAMNRNELFVQLVQHNPQVVVMDYLKEDDFGVEAVADVRRFAPGAQIIVSTDDKNKDRLMQAMDNGALCFLTKECDTEEIMDCIRAASRAEKFFCNKILDIILSSETEKRAKENCEPSILSDRELEIVRLIAKGLRSHEIATDLFLSVHTVNTHRKNIFRKMDVRSVTEMVNVAMQSNWIS